MLIGKFLLFQSKLKASKTKCKNTFYVDSDKAAPLCKGNASGQHKDWRTTPTSILKTRMFCRVAMQRKWKYDYFDMYASKKKKWRDKMTQLIFKGNTKTDLSIMFSTGTKMSYSNSCLFYSPVPTHRPSLFSEFLIVLIVNITPCSVCAPCSLLFHSMHK